jgi:hypothetical protein
MSQIRKSANTDERLYRRMMTSRFDVREGKW